MKHAKLMKAWENLRHLAVILIQKSTAKFLLFMTVHEQIYVHAKFPDKGLLKI